MKVSLLKYSISRCSVLGEEMRQIVFQVPIPTIKVSKSQQRLVTWAEVNYSIASAGLGSIRLPCG